MHHCTQGQATWLDDEGPSPKRPPSNRAITLLPDKVLSYAFIDTITTEDAHSITYMTVCNMRVCQVVWQASQLAGRQPPCHSVNPHQAMSERCTALQTMQEASNSSGPKRHNHNH